MSLAWWQTPHGKKLIEKHIPALAENVDKLNTTLETLLPKADLEAEIYKRDEEITGLKYELNMLTRKLDASETKVIELEGRLEEETHRKEVGKWPDK